MAAHSCRSFNHLNVDDNLLVAGPLEGKVAEGVGGLPAVLGRALHEPGVGVVLDVVPVDVVLDVVQGPVGPLHQLQDGHHEDVDLGEQIYRIFQFSELNSTSILGSIGETMKIQHFSI